jgi:hypothetical protein
VRWHRSARAADERDAEERLAAAGREVELSRRRLAETRETVVKPLQKYTAGNGFAEIIAAGLVAGHRKENGSG